MLIKLFILFLFCFFCMKRNKKKNQDKVKQTNSYIVNVSTAWC